jgi:hypothetical protein
MNEAAKMANPKGAERLMAALRDVSAAEQRHGKAIARRLNMYATDFEALSFVVERCALTTGEVGRKLGLTSGAATGVIDRLAERASSSASAIHEIGAKLSFGQWLPK